MPDLLDNFLTMLASCRDTALLRFSLGNEYLKQGDAIKAAEHLRRAVEHDPKYSAAWKLLGKALTDAENWKEALAAYQQGIGVAEARGDKQAAKEMGVFARRIEAALTKDELGLKSDDCFFQEQQMTRTVNCVKLGRAS